MTNRVCDLESYASVAFGTHKRHGRAYGWDHTSCKTHFEFQNQSWDAIHITCQNENLSD